MEVDLCLVPMSSSTVLSSAWNKYKPLHGEFDPFELSLSVQDNGCGISAEELPKIFEPFFRCAAHVRHVTGTGLGMCVIKALVDLMQGHVVVTRWVSVTANGVFCF